MKKKPRKEVCAVMCNCGHHVDYHHKCSCSRCFDENCLFCGCQWFSPEFRPKRRKV